MDPNQPPKTQTQTPIKKPSIPVPTSKLPTGIPTPGSVSGIPTASGIKRSTTTGEIKPPAQTDGKLIKGSSIQPPQSLVAKLAASNANHEASTGKEPLKATTAIPSIATANDRRASTNDLQKLKVSESTTSGLKPPTPVASNLTQSSSVTNMATTSASVTTAAASSASAEQINNNGYESNSLLAKENESLKLTIKDLEEKLETLKIKRAEDRDKLKEYPGLKLEFNKLEEFKATAKKQISDLNKELVQLKQESKTYKDQYESYKDEMSNYNERLEEMTVDKELAEVKIEEQQEEITKLKDKVEELTLELEILKGEIEVNGVGGAAESFQLKQAEKKQERLEAALIKLRDLNIQDKAEINNLRKQNEDLLSKITKLTKESESLKSENASFMNQIIDLKDQVTATLGSVQMIEQLTEQNLNLESKIQELETQVADLESINEVDNQLIESAKEEEKELRESLDLAESRIRDCERQIESLKYNIADHDKTIIKFREVVKQLQSENEKLNRQYQTKLEDEKAASMSLQQSANFDFKTKFIESKNYAKIVENEANKIEINNLRKHVNYLLTFMNEHFMRRGGDNECILTILLFKRITSKSDLILKEVKEKFPPVERIDKEDVTKTNKAEQAGFLYEISMLLSFVQLIASRFDSALNTCGLNQYTNIGSMYLDLAIQEKALDNLIDLLQKNQLDETTNLETLEKACIALSTIYKNHLSEEKYDNCILVNDLVKFATYSCELIGLEIQRLQLLTQVKENETSEVVVLFKEIYNLNDEIKNTIKKLNRFIPKDEKKQIIFNQELLNDIDSLMKHLHKLAKFLHLMSNESNSVLTLFANNTSKDDGIPPKKLEDLAYQICDKVYLNDDSGPYENIRNSLQEANNILNKLATKLENGEFEKALNEEEIKVNAPVVLASESFKNILVEAESIKYSLAAKEEEIKDIKKHLKFKSDELSENKVRLSLMEKKYENAQKEGEEKANKLQQTIDELKASIAKNEKEHSDTLEVLQQEVDSLQNEKRELKEKLRHFTKRNLLEGIMTRQTSEPKSPSSDSLSLSSRTLNINESPALIEEIKILKNTIKLLEDRNTELRIENAKALLNNLPEIEKSKKPLNLVKQSDRDSVDEVTNLYKESNKLLKDLYSSLANVKIPDIKADLNQGGNKRLLKNLEENYQINNMSKKCNEIEKKLIQLQSNLIPGSCVKTSLNLFTTPEFHKATNEKPVLVAEIAIPCVKGKEKQVDLFLNNKDIKEILKTVSVI